MTEPKRKDFTSLYEYEEALRKYRRQKDSDSSYTPSTYDSYGVSNSSSDSYSGVGGSFDGGGASGDY